MKLNAIFQFLVPKDSSFFPMFVKVADNLVVGCKALKVLADEKENSKFAGHVDRIKEIEQVGDNFTHDIFKELNSTFITPFDRQDIQDLTSSIDNVLDHINGACQRIKAYKPKRLPDELSKFADILIESSELILYSVKEIRSQKTYHNIKQACVKINTLENVGDDLYHSGISSLFENEKDPIELIILKEILQSIEKATDCAEDVADVLRTIVIKQS
jgi:uncharacterized protein